MRSAAFENALKDYDMKFGHWFPVCYYTMNDDDRDELMVRFCIRNNIDVYCAPCDHTTEEGDKMKREVKRIHAMIER